MCELFFIHGLDNNADDHIQGILLHNSLQAPLGLFRIVDSNGLVDF